MEFDKKYNDPIIIDNKILEVPPLGFHNTGSICYFNSLIQCLLSSKNFLKFILYDKNDPLFSEFLYNIVNDTWDMTFTTKILQKYNIVQGNQSSSEYFTFMVDLMKLENIFECHHKIINVCQNCGNKKESKDISYNTLINENILEFFKYNEKIDNVNCDNCKTKSTIEQNKIIYGLPPVIVLSFNKYFGKKIINYPELFNNGEVEYRLIGTVEHYGVLGAGHYISRFKRNGKFNLADDSRVNEIKSINSIQETYMVFYERIR
jgi:ubiquitin C-terminal hydrolase